MYKLHRNREGYINCAELLGANLVFPLSVDNTDYQQFKLDLTNGAELQDADGNVMTAEQVAEFMETLP